MPVSPFVVIVKAGQLDRLKNILEATLQHLVTVYLADNYGPSVETEAAIEGIHALNREMIAAG